MHHPALGFLAAFFAAMFLMAVESHIKKEALWKQTIAIIALLAAIEVVFLGSQP